MNSVIYSPLEDFEKKLKGTHEKNVSDFFESLVKRSGVDIEANRRTVAEYDGLLQSTAKLRRKFNLLRFLRVLACITIILIPLVIWVMTPKIKALREEIANADKKAAELLATAEGQMLPLNRLFGERDALELIEKTLPLTTFYKTFTAAKEEGMRENYDFTGESSDSSSLDLLAGDYNGNPFLFENTKIHEMGTETYHGYKTIRWTETYRDSSGKLQRRTRSETLHATVVKPKPYFKTQVVLNYGAQAAPDLTFSRDASHLDIKSEKELDRHVKRGEKKLKRKSDRAIKKNDDFTAMANTDFEVLFDALDRSDEVQFRTLFTPLAQTNMTDLILSKSGYGDDFHFFKIKRMNKIVTGHSQGRAINLLPDSYVSYSFDVIRENFNTKNCEFFKAVYFDLAPVLAIPAYQDRPVHSLEVPPSFTRLYSARECEALANMANKELFVHSRTKTEAILKAEFEGSEKSADRTRISAYSYDIEPRVDIVSVYGGDGRFHNVSVPWDEYIPLERHESFLVGSEKCAENKKILSKRQGVCLFE